MFDLSVGHKGLKELLFSWTCHTLPTQVIVTRIHASEEKLMASVDLSMARVAVKNASIGLEGSTLYPPDLGVIELSLVQGVAISTAHLRLCVLTG